MQKQIVHHNLVTEHLLFHPLFRTNSIKQCHLQFYGTYFPLLIFSMETVWQTHFPKDKEHYWNLQISSTAHGGKSPQIPSYQMPCHSCRLIIGRTNLKDTPLNPGPKNLPRANEDNNGRGEHERDGSQTNEYWQRFASKSLQIDPTLVGKNNKKKKKIQQKQPIACCRQKQQIQQTQPRWYEQGKETDVCTWAPILLDSSRLADGGASAERTETISSGSTAEEPKQNETKREGIEKRGPKTYLASPRLVSSPQEQNNSFFFFAFACVFVRLIGGRRRDARHRRRGGSKGNAGRSHESVAAGNRARCQCRGFRGSQPSVQLVTWFVWLKDRWADLLGPHGKGCTVHGLGQDRWNYGVVVYRYNCCFF